MILPDLLYHTLLTVIDYHADPSGASRSVHVLGTHATVAAAKAFASNALHGLGYDPADFTEHAVRAADTPWPHGDGVLVHARAPAGHVFTTSIATTPNTASLQATPAGEVVVPTGAASLHYVVQTTVDYNADRTGAAQETEVEGAYVYRAEALAAARRCLDEGAYVEFDVREDMKGEWPFGEDVVVHAVAEGGQNATVAVRTVPGAHKRHGKQK
ncbi:hypothetical protein B0T10DRAFT_558686 [Thelonectria olida]|uniref:Uncharacterized protein n=1 Tax=Thelonectria olida TaxID=1576542 RepID=A0A9P9AVN9_9HYPO|nr:hypothetical protein B0T10DRAFT_558686 [Thelonectria olida]